MIGAILATIGTCGVVLFLFMFFVAAFFESLFFVKLFTFGAILGVLLVLIGVVITKGPYLIARLLEIFQ